MHIINLFSKTVLASSLLMMSTVSFAHNGEDHRSYEKSTTAPIESRQLNHAQMCHAQHQTKHLKKHESEFTQDGGGHHDHRKEHGAQIYAVTTMDNQWLVNDDGTGALKSEFETRIGTDENKVFVKVHADKEESHDAHYDAKILYSRMISDFWDAQLGARYRSEKVARADHLKDTEGHVDAVIGLHGMAPYFFETDAYLYLGEDSYASFSLETERDFLITQKLIMQPYLELDLIFNDGSKYAKKTGLSGVTAGIETRYEISKKVLPYINIAYEYSKGNDETSWQRQSDSTQNWIYGTGIKFKF
ncbi:copper resistance protein B [Acinetobacter sp. ASP199]|uniref:copper resistance protein B n=1 Tax=unclassified Acinetobacter TaxID=196816 RepID=UPI001F616444|nr:copper resistance protein B [Acinetobacter sp. ASP199]UNT58095.1 copper resistance protein B [Acinetobacter sp. ASP199]